MKTTVDVAVETAEDTTRDFWAHQRLDLLLAGCTLERKQQIVHFLEYKVPADLPTRSRELPWPSWDGEVETFCAFLFELEVKIEEDRHLLGSNRAVCLEMLRTLPKHKKHRVDMWFRRGGLDGNYDWRNLLEYFQEQFLGRAARMSATGDMITIRQGAVQPFHEYLKDFECKMMQCKGERWQTSNILTLLHNGLNLTLQEVLITACPPFDWDYLKWVSRVGEIASELESLPARRPPENNIACSWYLSRHEESEDLDTPEANPGMARIEENGEAPHLSRINARRSNSRNVENETVVDRPSTMQGSLNAGSAAEERLTKARAPWRPEEELTQLRLSGRCIRCGELGHISHRCPTYRSAQRPFPE